MHEGYGIDYRATYVHVSSSIIYGYGSCCVCVCYHTSYYIPCLYVENNNNYDAIRLLLHCVAFF